MKKSECDLTHRVDATILNDFKTTIKSEFEGIKDNQAEMRADIKELLKRKMR